MTSDSDDNVVHAAFGERDYAQGRARCMRCKYEFQAVIPQEDMMDFIDCPKCERKFAILIHPFAPADDPVWTCDCGNQLFYITPKGHYCPNCAAYQTYD